MSFADAHQPTMQIWTAVVAGIFTTLGAVVTLLATGWKHRLERKDEWTREREQLVRRYLSQMEDAVESLLRRLYNLRYKGGRPLMEDSYFEVSTLYALGRVLGIERIFALEGVYPLIGKHNPQLRHFLEDNTLDSQLEGMNFHKYDRLALAEAAIQSKQELFRTSTYLEFRKRYVPGSHGYDWLQPGRKAIEFLTNSNEKMDNLLTLLGRISDRLKTENGSVQATKTSRVQLAQARARRYLKPGVSAVDELLAERRKEAERE